MSLLQRDVEGAIPSRATNFGLRWQAQRDTAFERGATFRTARSSENAAAATALPGAPLQP
jgi:hypothetical protein